MVDVKVVAEQIANRALPSRYPPPLPPLVVTIVEAARLLAMSRRTVYTLLSKGELKSYKDGKIRKIIVSSIEDYVRRRDEFG